jgi:hypothetical protein
VLIQGDSPAALALQSSSTAVAPIGADVNAPLVLLSSETASDPVQSVESATLLLQGSATGSVLDGADGAALLLASSSSDASVLENAAADAPLLLVSSSDAFTLEITADADAPLVLSSDSSAHNDAQVMAIGGGSHYQRRPRATRPAEPGLPTLSADAGSHLSLLAESGGDVIVQAEGFSALKIMVRSSATRGPDPMEALLFLIAA